MNATELIGEVSDIILEPDIGDVEILKYLNRGQLAIADKILLPGLAGGHDTVTTVIDGYSVPLPSDFHRGLFLAQTYEGEIRIVKSIRDIASLVGPLNVEGGSVMVVAAHTKNLIYQMVPGVGTEIELFYHRKPVPMEDEEESFPDGITKDGGQDEALEQALIYFACWKCYSKTEDGIEGATPNTIKYRGWFKDIMSELRLLCHQEGVSYPKAAPNKVW